MAASNAVRVRVAAVVWTVAVVLALVLAVGALLTALDANQKNDIVRFIHDLAKSVSGPFGDIFTFTTKHGGKEIRDLKKDVLVNWGLAAIVYLIIGKIVAKIIRPGS
ncbi:MAG: hypothetical protein ACRDP1_07415 [Nocardioidaceae bacterium]